MAGPLRPLSVLKMRQQPQQFLSLSIGINDVGGQVAVQRVSDLVDVVTDVAELGKDRRVQLHIARHRLNLALADETLAQAREGQPGLTRIHASPQVLVRRKPDRNRLAARGSRVCASPGHSIASSGLRSGRGDRALTGGVQGSGGALSPARGICNRLPASAVQTIANPHLATPRFYATCFTESVRIRFLSYSQLHIAHCDNSRNYVQR